MNEFEERRKHVRLPISTSVFIYGETFDRIKTQTMDLSDGGQFAQGDFLSSLEVNSIVQVQSAEDLEDPPLLTARIAWINRFGAGLEYLLDD